MERVTHEIVFSYEVIADNKETIELVVKNPADKQVVSTKHQQHLDKFVFQPEVVGLYRFCFANHGRQSELVGFAIYAEDEEYPDLVRNTY